MTEAEAAEFTESYAIYQRCCDSLQAVKKALVDTQKEVSDVMAKTPIYSAGQGIEHWDVAKVIAAAEAIGRLAQANHCFGRALQNQAEALRGTADLAEKFVKRAREKTRDG